MATQIPSKPNTPRPKVLRFALRGLDGETYRTLADLRAAEVVPLEYLYALHCDGTLERWLGQQHCAEELEALRALPKEQAGEEHLRTLADILYPGAELDIDALVRHWKMAELWREQRGEQVDRQQNLAHAVDLYWRGFRDLCQALIDDAKDMPALKEHLLRLEQEYLPLVRWLIGKMINFMWQHSPACLLLLLASRSYRRLLEEKGQCSALITSIENERGCFKFNFNFRIKNGKLTPETNCKKTALGRINRENADSALFKSLFAEMGMPLQASISTQEEDKLNLVDFFTPYDNSGITTLVLEGVADGSDKYHMVASADREYMLMPEDDGYFRGRVRACGGRAFSENSKITKEWPVIRGIEIANDILTRFYYMEVF